MRAIRTALLVGLGVLVGALMITPAGAHLDGLRHVIKHLKKTFYTEAEADDRFLSPAEADDRFLSSVEADAMFLTQSEGESQFLPRDEIRLSQVGPWMVFGSGNVTMPATYVTVDPTSGTDITARLLLVAPKAVGVPYALRDVEICYVVGDGTGGDKIDQTSVLDFVPSGSEVMVSDDTDQTSTTFSPFQCYTITDPTPNVPSGSPALSIFFSYNDDTQDSVSFNSVTTTWVPA